MATEHKESQQSNSKPLSQTRRSALKKMLVGTGVAAGAATLPDKWTKPLVDRVLVPAHAQTSTTTTTTEEPLPTSFRGEASIQVNPSNTKSAKTGLIETLAGKILPVAHAYPQPVPTEVDFCIKIINDTMFEAKLLFKLPLMPPGKKAAFAVPSGENGIPYGYYFFEGSGTVGDTAVDFDLEVEPCYGHQIPQVQIAVSMISATGAIYAITGGVTGSAPPSLPVEGGCPVKPEPEECDD